MQKIRFRYGFVLKAESQTMQQVKTGLCIEEVKRQTFAFGPVFQKFHFFCFLLWMNVNISQMRTRINFLLLKNEILYILLL